MLAMEIRPKSAPATGPAEMFTGDVTIEPIARGEAPSRLAVSAVSFSPGARTAWHSHESGQTLHVTVGEGRIQSRGEPIVTIREGDTIHAADGEWHWHGAGPDQAMTHLSITEGRASWGEHVTDAEYRGDAT
jgi:quercetin dioxygenase-like cupin family protein